MPHNSNYYAEIQTRSQAKQKPVQVSWGGDELSPVVEFPEELAPLEWEVRGPGRRAPGCRAGKACKEPIRRVLDTRLKNLHLISHGAGSKGRVSMWGWGSHCKFYVLQRSL